MKVVELFSNLDNMENQEDYQILLHSKNKADHLRALELMQSQFGWSLTEALAVALNEFIQQLNYEDIEKTPRGDSEEVAHIYFGTFHIQIQIHYQQYSTISWRPTNHYIISKRKSSKKLFYHKGNEYNSGPAYYTIELSHFKATASQEIKVLIPTLQKLIIDGSI